MNEGRSKGSDNYRLMPHQAEFSASFLDPHSPAFHLLTGPPGTGKTITGISIVQRMVDEGKAKSILFITPARALADFVLRSLRARKQPVPVTFVEKKRLREMAAELPAGENPLSSPRIAIATSHSIHDVDTSQMISSITWDLVVIDEVQQLFVGSSLAAFLGKLVEADRVQKLLMILVEHQGTRPKYVPDGTKITKWTSTVVDWDGQPLIREADKRVIDYNRSQPEVRFLKRLLELQKTWPADVVAPGTSSIQLRLASSSLFAVQKSLMNLRNRIVHDLELDIMDDSDEEGAASEETPSDRMLVRLDPEPVAWNKDKLVDDISHLDDLVRKVTVDSKLEGLALFLREQEIANQGNRTCIFSRYSSTLYYLASALEQHYERPYLITGSVRPEVVSEQLHQFAAVGGLLLASPVTLTGIAWRSLGVKVLVNYDLPSSPIEMQRRSLIVAGSEGGSIWTFLDASGVLPQEATLLKRHGFGTGQDPDPNTGTSQLSLLTDE